MKNLWNNKGVPHKNWKNVDIYDNGKGNYIKCEMCGKEGIRYAHVMSHINYKRINVGCVCAEKMCKDYDGAAAKNAFLKKQKKAEALLAAIQKYQIR